MYTFDSNNDDNISIIIIVVLFLTREASAKQGPFRLAKKESTIQYVELLHEQQV